MTFIIFKNDISNLNLSDSYCPTNVDATIGYVDEKYITSFTPANTGRGYDHRTANTPFALNQNRYTEISGNNNNNIANDPIYKNGRTRIELFDKDKIDYKGCYFQEETCDDFKDTNIKFYDSSLNIKWNLCHTNSLKKIYDEKSKENSQMKNLLLVIFVSSLALLGLGICGTCYEFWLKYGDSVDCLYYKSNCKNAGPNIIKSNGDTTSSEISLIDYMYPNNISYYPYQRCLMASDKFSSQSGGDKNEVSGFKSNYKQYALNNTRCIKVFQDKDTANKRPFPYNIADYANENINSNIIKMPFKSFSFQFLFPVLLSRIILNVLLKSLSNAYQKTIEKNNFMKTLVFLMSNGLIFVLLGALGFGGLTAIVGPFTIVMGLTSIVNFVMNLTPSTILMLFPKTFFFIINGGVNGMTETCKKILIKDSKSESSNKGDGDPWAYYRIIGPDNFYPISKGPSNGPNDSGRTLTTRILNFVKNIYMIFAILFMFVFSLVTGIFGFILAIIYLSTTIFFNTFYIPLSNPLEFFDLLKSHSQILTLLYCAFVVGGMKLMGFNENTVAISSGVLGIIIIYKLLSMKLV